MDTVIGELPRERAGSGTALTMTVRQVGGALGVAMLGSILSAVYLHRLDTTGLPAPAAGAAKDSIAGAMAVAQKLGDAALARSATEAFVHGMSVVLLVCAGFALLGSALVAFLMPGRPVAQPAGDGEESEHELAGIA
jgi:hypothetical protein